MKNTIKQEVFYWILSFLFVASFVGFYSLATASEDYTAEDWQIVAENHAREQEPVEPTPTLEVENVLEIEKTPTTSGITEGGVVYGRG